MKKRGISLLMTALLLAASCSLQTPVLADSEETVTLRVCNWEEYIDLGDWDEEETIDLESGDIIGENSAVTDFEEWYYENYGVRVKVEYSTFGTNEDLYSMLTLGDVYDVVCPSEYMIMKLIAEDQVVPFSEEFFDESNELNYYMKGVSPYIRNVFETNEIQGKYWDKYAAGYMWGVTGLVYNPEEVTEEQVAHWSVIGNPDVAHQVTIKDNVRDTYFAAMGALKEDLLTSEEFLSDPEYHENLAREMNDVSPETIQKVQDYLQDVKDNVYSFETDSGKSDMITGKVLVNFQWSGDGVYALDQAEEDDFYLNFAVPEEVTNIYFDGWIMLKNGIEQDPAKQQAAEAWVNFMSRPDIAVRNMYYIGYTSVISGGEDERIWEYLDWCYGAEEDEEDVVEYPLGLFFSGDESDEDYILETPEEQTHRQLFAQYPPAEVLDRSAIMQYFDDEANAMANQMWINIRCYNIKDVPPYAWGITGVLFVLLVAGLVMRKLKNQ